MRYFKGLIITSAVALLSTTAGAQVTVVIDNQTIPTDHIESITVLKNTNVVSIATTVPYTVTPAVVGDDVTITSFTVSPSSVEQGESATLSWSSENATSCTGSGGVGGWDVADIPVNGSLVVTTSEAGSPVFTLTCSGPVGADDVRSVTLNVTLANAVAITSFGASPSNIAEGESTTLSWVTDNALSCTPTGGTAEWRETSITVPSGSAAITIAVADTYAFGLSCSGEVGDPVSASTSVTVSPPNPCGATALDGNIVSWSSFWGEDFPFPAYKNVDTMLPRGWYRAIHFNTGDVLDTGRLKMIENTLSPITVLGAISECPGDFDVTPACDYVWGLGGELVWSTSISFRTCFLEPNKDYYFNITFTDGVDPATTTCGESQCRATMQHKNY